MSKLESLHNAVQRIDTDDYKKAISKLGPRPVSTIQSAIDNYQAKKDELNKQIINAKKDVGMVAGSISALDKKLSSAQSILGPVFSKLEKGLDTKTYGYQDLISQAKKAQKQVAVIRANIYVMDQKLAELGTVLKR